MSSDASTSPAAEQALAFQRAAHYYRLLLEVDDSAERSRWSRCLGDALAHALLPGAARAVRRLNRSGVRAVVVTNQPVVARGMCTEEELARIHARLEMARRRHHTDPVHVGEPSQQRRLVGDAVLQRDDGNVGSGVRDERVAAQQPGRDGSDAEHDE